jgi:hypothetical protein
MCTNKLFCNIFSAYQYMCRFELGEFYTVSLSFRMSRIVCSDFLSLIGFAYFVRVSTHSALRHGRQKLRLRSDDCHIGSADAGAGADADMNASSVEDDDEDEDEDANDEEDDDNNDEAMDANQQSEQNDEHPASNGNQASGVSSSSSSSSHALARARNPQRQQRATMDRLSKILLKYDQTEMPVRRLCERVRIYYCVRECFHAFNVLMSG